MILDDFGATSAYISNFDKNISTIRSRDIYASLIIQSLSQLATMYDANAAKTIINNCDTLLFMGCNDPDTARMIADRASKTMDNMYAKGQGLCDILRQTGYACRQDRTIQYASKRSSDKYVKNYKRSKNHATKYKSIL